MNFTSVYMEFNRLHPFFMFFIYIHGLYIFTLFLHWFTCYLHQFYMHYMIITCLTCHLCYGFWYSVFCFVFIHSQFDQPIWSRKIDPTSVIIPVVTELLDFYQLLRMKGKDLVELPEMDRIGRNFLDMSRETFKDFTVGKKGQENTSAPVKRCTE